MKIVCESCGAKYSIADDRVTGKVFKIRCKRCSEVIIVRGDQQAQPAAEQPPAGASQDQGAIWHVVVDGEQAGPYAPSQLAEMLSAGTVDWEAYVWTEGFDNWLPMRDVPDLVSQITGQGGAQQQPAIESRAAAYRSSVNETLTGQPSMGADPFADDAAPGEGGLFGGGAVAAAGPDLFGRTPATAASGPFAGGLDSGVITSAPNPRVDAAQAMTGARNENSVLFSLKNLQALATGSGTSLAPATTAPAERAGYAGGEGSGLIDIRALATATGVNEASGGGGSRDELLSIGSQGGAFGTLGSPMLAPVGDDGDGNKKVLVWALVAVVGFLSMAAVAIIYIMRPAPGSTPVAVAPAAAVGTAVAATQPTETLKPADAPSEGALAAARATQEAKNDEPSGRSSGERSARRRTGSSDSSGSKSGDSEPAESPIAAEKRDAPAKPGGPKSIDELLDGALSGSPTKGKTAADTAPRANLPEAPTREQVVSAMNSVKPAVSSCAQGQTGIAMVTVSVAGETGRVTNAQVSGVTGPAGSCVAQAVRRAQFPKFQNKVFKVQFPFKL